VDVWLRKYRGYLILSLIFLTVLGGAVLWWHPAPTPIEIVEPSPRPTRTPAWIMVYVSGAVEHPDVYSLVENSRVKDALSAAGGFRSDADPSTLNLAAPLHDGQEIHVPTQGEAPRPSTSAVHPSNPVNINTASAEELDGLPGIGPVLAQRIVEDRQANGPYESIEELARVKGIGPALLEKLQGLITIR